MELALREHFPDLPEIVLWKAELMFGGLRFTDALARAVEEGAAPNFYPYRRRHESGQVDSIQVPYLFDLGGQAVARIRVDDRAGMEVRRDDAGRYALWSVGAAPRELCEVQFVRKHGWQDFRTADGLDAFAAGAEQLGDMIVVNVAPGCEYFSVRAERADGGGPGAPQKCSFCAYGRFDRRSLTLGQEQGRLALDELTPKRIEAVLRAAAAGVDEPSAPHARHVYITGGSVLDPVLEVERFLPVIEAVRRGVGDRLRVTIGSGAVDPAGSRRYRDAGADSACYNLETWDAATFEACCPGKAKYVGRQRWIDGLLGAVDAFGRGNVGSAFVAGLELVPPGPCLSHDAFVASVVEGATFLLDHGIAPLYSPLWPIDGTSYKITDGIPPTLYVRLQRELYALRAARRFPVPGWLICPSCSFMLLEVDFDRALGLDRLGASPAGRAGEDPCVRPLASPAAS
ncbi:MAG: hypothetical protein H6708_01680 [Kofleriaceae bacterium]|nr:hypothetical protein [Myxococcales bacterium]MCB9559101.1 hypothetical protein [Kofleriaceae bacterium]